MIKMNEIKVGLEFFYFATRYKIIKVYPKKKTVDLKNTIKGKVVSDIGFYLVRRGTICD